MHIRQIIFISILAVTGILFVHPASAALTMGQRLSGRILRQVESGGSLWYVSPLNNQRYYLKDDPSSFNLFKDLSVAMSVDNLNQLPLVGSTDVGSAALRLRFSGRIVRQSATSTMWYISPLNLLRYPLNDAPLTTLKKLGLGITDANLNLIPIASGFDKPKAPPVPVNGLLRTQKSVVTSLGTFTIDLATLDLTKTTLKIKTDTAQTTDCKNGCLTLPLKTYNDRRHAVFSMYGTYFCPLEYASCVGQTGSYYFPVVNSFSRVMVNGDRLKYTTEPMVTIDMNNVPHFYYRAMDFLGSNLFSSINLSNVQAAISNGPALIEKGVNVANPDAMDTKQRTVKSYRGAIGWKGSTMYFYVVRGATVTDSAAVAEALGLDYAMNLDGGGSTAMMQNGSYILGPGRNIPDAILLVP